ncbi:MAG TPA: hypothetical protein VGJ05_12540 [Fimbriiglobus sp.]
MLFAALICLGFSLALFVAILVAMFRLSCGWCGLPRPGVLSTLGVIFVSFVVEVIAGGVVQGSVYAGYERAGWPLWEAGVVIFFLQLPFDLAVSSLAHAGLMKIAVGKAIEVWFVQRLLLLGLVAFVIGAAAVIILAQ